jgi:AraC-like DNA-binding protein
MNAVQHGGFMKEISIAARAVQFIFNSKSNELRNLTVNRLAAELHVDVSDLSTRFEKEFGIPIRDFLIECQAVHAMELLIKNKDLSVKEVSELMDIDDNTDLIEMFKQHFGVTPDQYHQFTG